MDQLRNAIWEALESSRLEWSADEDFATCSAWGTSISITTDPDDAGSVQIIYSIDPGFVVPDDVASIRAIADGLAALLVPCPHCDGAAGMVCAECSGTGYRMKRDRGHLRVVRGDT